jgi:hypothetical protein
MTEFLLVRREDLRFEGSSTRENWCWVFIRMCFLEAIEEVGVGISLYSVFTVS